MEKDVFFAEVKKVLEEKKTVRIRVRGNSMLPFIRHNDCVILAYPAPGKIRRGSIVVAYTDELGYVMHRIVEKKGEQLILLGDGNVNQFEHTDCGRVIAVVTQYERGKRIFSVDGLGMRIVGRVWYMMHPWRKRVLDVWWKIKLKLC